MFITASSDSIFWELDVTRGFTRLLQFLLSDATFVTLYKNCLTA